MLYAEESEDWDKMCGEQHSHIPPNPTTPPNSSSSSTPAPTPHSPHLTKSTLPPPHTPSLGSEGPLFKLQPPGKWGNQFLNHNPPWEVKILFLEHSLLESEGASINHNLPPPQEGENSLFGPQPPGKWRDLFFEQQLPGKWVTHSPTKKWRFSCSCYNLSLPPSRKWGALSMQQTTKQQNQITMRNSSQDNFIPWDCAVYNHTIVIGTAKIWIIFHCEYAHVQFYPPPYWQY